MNWSFETSVAGMKQLDPHVPVWWWLDLPRLPVAAWAATADPDDIVDTRAAGIPDTPHCDPLDRMLAARALHEEKELFAGDAMFRTPGATMVWA